MTCHVYLMLMYKDKFLTVKMDEIFNKKIGLIFDLVYKD